MRYNFLRDLFGRKVKTIRRVPLRTTASLWVEALESRDVPSSLTFSQQTNYFGVSGSVSQPRSLRGLALTPDGSSLYGGFILGTTSAAIREVPSTAQPAGQVTGNEIHPYSNGVDTIPAGAYQSPIEHELEMDAPQAKGIATDDRGNVYTTLNSRSASTTQSFAIYSADLSTQLSQISVTDPNGASQESGLAVQKLGGHYYLYLSHNGGTGTITRYNVDNPAAPVLDTSWGTNGSIDLQSQYGASAYANGIAVAADGTLYAAGGVLPATATRRGDAVFEVPADGNLTASTQVNVNGAMDLALFQGRVYVTEYLADQSAVTVLNASDLSFRETDTGTGSFPHTNTNADSGYSGIDISSNGTLYVADQLYSIIGTGYTPPAVPLNPTPFPITSQVLFDQILEAPIPLDTAGPITSNVVLTPNSVSGSFGGTITVTATVDDTTTGGSTISGAQYSLDGGTTWLAMTAQDGTFNSVTENVTATFTLADLNVQGPGPYTILVRGTDAAGNTGAAASGTLTLTSAPPTITGTVANQPVNDNATIAPFTTVTIANPGSPGMSLSVSVTVSPVADGTFTAASLTASGFVSAGGGLYTFTGTGGDATTAIRQLVFQPTANQVTPGSIVTTTLTIAATNNTDTRTDSHTTVVATSINDAPTITGAVAGQSTTDYTPISPFASVTIGDVDPGQTQAVRVTLSNAANGSFSAASLTASGFVNAGGGVYTFSGSAAAATNAIRQLVFDPTVDQVPFGQTVTTTFTISTYDGVAPTVTNNTTTVLAFSANYVPTISGTVSPQATNDKSTINPFSGVTITDLDSPPQSETVTVTPGNLSNGVFSSASLTASGFAFSGTNYFFLGTAAAATTAIRQLVFVPTANQVAPGDSVLTNFAIAVNDGIATTTDSSTNVTSLSINDPPTISGAVAGQTVNDNSMISLFGGVTIGDVDNPAQTQTVTVSLSTAANGTLTNLNGFVDNLNGSYTFTGTAASATAAVRQLVFVPTANQVAPGSTVTTTLTISANDGLATTTNNTTTVVATSINDAPTITGAVAGQPVTDKTTVAPFTGVTIGDVDVPAQTLTVTVTLSSAANGSFSAASLTASGFTNSGGGVYTFTGTAAAATTAIRQLVFVPTANQVTPGSAVTTTFAVAANDGFVTTTNSTTTVVATSVNDAPTITGTVANQAVNDNSTVAPFTGVTIADVDVGQTETVSITFTNPANGTFSAASLAASGFGLDTAHPYYLIIGNGSATYYYPYVYSGTPAAVTAAIRQLVFVPTPNQVAPGNTVTTGINIAVSDGIATTTDSTTSVVATSINDAPTIAGTAAGQAVNDNATVNPFSSVTIGDADYPPQTLTLTVTLSNAANGVLGPTNGLQGQFVYQGGGVYTLTASAVAATYDIRALTFTPTANQVAPGSTVTTTFTLAVNDGVATTSDNTTTVIATSINDAPTISGMPITLPVTDKTTITPFSGVTIGDVDTPAQTQAVSVTLGNAANGSFSAASLTASGFTASGGGVYSFSGTAAAATTAIRQLVFVPTANQVAPGSTVTTPLTIAVNDGIVGTSASANVTATSVNDAPTITGTVAGQTVANTSTIAPFAGVTIADPDVGQTQTVVVTLSNAANGSFSAASLTASGFTAQGGGAYRYAGTPAAVTTAIRQLVFVPTAHVAATTTFGIADGDGVVTTTDNTTSVIATNANTPPAITGTVAGQTVNNTSTIAPFTGVTISDPDAGQTQTVTVTLSVAANGVFSAASLTASGFTSQGGGAYGFAGSAAAATTAIRQLVFVPSGSQTPGSQVTTTFTVASNDGFATTSNNTTTVVSTGTDHAPTITGTTTGGFAITDLATVKPFPAVTIGDADVPAQTQTVTVSLVDPSNGAFSAASLTASGFTTSGGGVYTFTGTAAAATTAIRQLVFVPTAHQVAPGSTVTSTLTIASNDGYVTTTSAATMVAATATNTAPTIAGTVANQAVTDATTVTPFTGVTITDPDFGQTQTVTVALNNAANGSFSFNSVAASGFASLGNGRYSFTGSPAAATAAIRQLVFVPTANQVAPNQHVVTTFTITANDGVTSTSNTTTTVNALSVNDPSVITGTAGGQTVTDQTTINPFLGVTVTDADNPPQTETCTITLSAAANGVFSSNSLNGFTAMGGGVYRGVGTAAQIATALPRLVFVPTAHQVAPGSTVTTTFTIAVNDGFATTTDNTTTVVATSVNTPPAINNLPASSTIFYSSAGSKIFGASIVDPDNPAQTQTVTITQSDTSTGSFSAASLTASGFVYLGGGVYQFTGKAAAATTALSKLIFVPVAGLAPHGSSTSTVFSFSVTDGIDTTTASTNVNVQY